jgi:hypothetical protein
MTPPPPGRNKVAEYFGTIRVKLQKVYGIINQYGKDDKRNLPL